MDICPTAPLLKKNPRGNTRSENSLFPVKETKTRKVGETKERSTQWIKYRKDREKERQKGKASAWRGFMSGAWLLAMGLVPLWSTPL